MMIPGQYYVDLQSLERMNMVNISAEEARSDNQDDVVRITRILNCIPGQTYMQSIFCYMSDLDAFCDNIGYEPCRTSAINVGCWSGFNPHSSLALY